VTVHRTRRSFLALGLLAGCLAVVPGLCAAETRDGQYAPYENLIEVLADFARHLHDDLYRFPPPSDLTGGNLFAATLTRLENFRTLHPTDMPDVVTFAKAEREALHRYREHLRREGAIGASPPPEPMRRIAERVADADCERALRRARTAAAAKPATAHAYLEAARLIPGCERKIARQALANGSSVETPRSDPRFWPQDPLPPVPETAAPAGVLSI
jgi:hypothetical protein